MNTLTLEKPAAATRRRTVGIALLGCGTVGSGLVELLRSNGPLLARRAGAELCLRKVLVRDLSRDRGLPRALLTDDADEALSASGVDVVVELAGGLEPARTWIARALAAGKHVVTANKALLAVHGPELFKLARENGVSLGFSASVCGAVPVLGAISSGLAGDRVESLCGIVNGTGNYILTRMAEAGLAFDEALHEAQQAGFAEADPSLDVDGHDAAQKLAVLAGVAFGQWARLADIHVEGIRGVTQEDIRAAAEMGYVIKHVVAAGADGLSARPMLLAQDHPLARIRNEQNAVLIRCEAAGELLFTGAGAGSRPTAGSVLADLVDVALGTPSRNTSGEAPSAGVAATRVACAYYLRIPIVDVPGTIGLIATALGNRGISIRHARAVLAPGVAGTGSVYLLIHKCAALALDLALSHIANLPITRSKPMAIAIHEERGHATLI